MYSTRNKKCMLKLAKKDFLKNRTRNIVAVLAMILTTVLFATLAKVIKSDNRMYVYDALNNKLATINSKEDLLENESYENFLRDNDFRDIKKPCEFEVKYPFTEEELKGMFNRKVKSITLALTEQCNLRCKYCGYMPKYLDHDYHLKEMPKDVAFKAIDFLMKNSQESDVCNIGFYGGEPLLRLNLIKECIAYVKERYPFRQPTYNITTNATLLDDKVAAFLVENDIKITINLISILAYAENKEYEKMTGFIEEIMGEGGMMIASISNSGNIVIDSLIGYWYVTAQNKRIIFKTDICIPMIMPFKGADLSLILGNLLENAVEAAEKVEENRYINVKMKFDKNNLLLFVENSYKGKLLKTRDSRLKSTKSDAENHGVGLASVYRAVAKYHGSVIIEDSEPGKFKIRIVLYSNVQE